MIVVLLDLFYPLAVVNLFDEIIRFACSNAFGFSFSQFFGYSSFMIGTFYNLATIYLSCFEQT